MSYTEFLASQNHFLGTNLRPKRLYKRNSNIFDELKNGRVTISSTFPLLVKEKLCNLVTTVEIFSNKNSIPTQITLWAAKKYCRQIPICISFQYAKKFRFQFYFQNEMNPTLLPNFYSNHPGLDFLYFLMNLHSNLFVFDWFACSNSRAVVREFNPKINIWCVAAC
jgi:hypothetical protein